MINPNPSEQKLVVGFFSEKPKNPEMKKQCHEEVYRKAKEEGIKSVCIRGGFSCLMAIVCPRLAAKTRPRRKQNALFYLFFTNRGKKVPSFREWVGGKIESFWEMNVIKVNFNLGFTPPGRIDSLLTVVTDRNFYESSVSD